MARNPLLRGCWLDEAVLAFWLLDLSWLGTGRRAAALDAPRTLHHTKASRPRLTASTMPARHAAASRGHIGTQSAGVHANAAAVRAPGARQLGTRHAVGVRRASLTTRHHRYYERFTASSFASGDIFAGDITAGEDPVVRQAAIDALGDMNGTAVVIDPSNGRILAMVNQKLALSPGAEPCSTIKLTVALAALSEGLVTRDTLVQLGGFRMNMTEALAKSNNLYFEELGRELGFERVRHYATQFGLGELAGYNIRRRAARRLSRPGHCPTPKAAWAACAASARAFP